jgi:crotonobetainyl-CoA:carnitine CoA-transferase CaiB-like acyl-CoA transferase
MGALDGIRILDLTGGIAGPLGVLQLAEHGADVIKIEPPGGLSDRRLSSSVVYNRSRRSITLDLKRPEGIEVFRDLLATSDVVVEAFAPATMRSFGLDYESLQADFPRLVYCSIPAWPSGSRRENQPGWEALVHAQTGQQWESTSFRAGPVFLHSSVASYGAMFLVPIGILAALAGRDRTGRGQRVEVSLVQGVMSLTTQNWNWTDSGQFGLPKTHPAGVHQESIFECANGEWIHASTQSGQTPTATESGLLGLGDVSLQEVFAMTAQERADYTERRRQAYKLQDRTELIEAFHAAGLGAEAIVQPHEHFNHPQLRETGSVVQVDDPEVGMTTQLGMTIFLEATPGEVRGPQPRPGADAEDILATIGYDSTRIAGLREKGVI